MSDACSSPATPESDSQLCLPPRLPGPRSHVISSYQRSPEARVWRVPRPNVTGAPPYAFHTTHFRTPKPLITLVLLTIISSPPSPFSPSGKLRMCISLSFCLVCEFQLSSSAIKPPREGRLQSTRADREFFFWGLLCAAIRFSWQLRRKSRLAGKGRHSDGTIGTGRRDTEGSSVDHTVPRLDGHTPTDLHSIPERSKSQRGREREPPVVIGDPTVRGLFFSSSLPLSLGV